MAYKTLPDGGVTIKSYSHAGNSILGPAGLCNIGVLSERTRDVGGALDAAIEAFEGSRKECSKDWQAQLRTALYPLRDGLGADRDVTQVTRDDLQQYLDDGLAGRSASTMRSYMLVVRCFFNWLEEQGWIRINPARRIKLPKASARLRDFLPPEQVKPFLDACWKVQPDFAPIAMAIILGSFRKGGLKNNLPYAKTNHAISSADELEITTISGVWGM